MKKTLGVMALVLVVALAVHADIYVKSKVHTDATSFMGQNQPEKNEFSEQWIGDNKFATLGAEQSFLIDLKKNMIWMISHKSKSYIETSLPLDFAKLLPPEAAAMASMMTMKATVNPTTEKKKIGQWDCLGYDVTMTVMGMAMKMRVWATTDVPFDLNKYLTQMYGAVLKGQMRLDDASVKEMMKIKGFQIASELNANIMGAKIRTTTEVLEISKKNPPAGAYAVPAGYTKKDKLDMQDLQKQ
ncbi:MAG: DUF4412 domain-containing protein [Candidatus Aminicenantales bacterium]